MSPGLAQPVNNRSAPANERNAVSPPIVAGDTEVTICHVMGPRGGSSWLDEPRMNWVVIRLTTCQVTIIPAADNTMQRRNSEM